MSEQESMFNSQINKFFQMLFKHLKPIGVAEGEEKYLLTKEADGLILAADNPEFSKQFVEAIAKKRFWNRF